MHIYIHIYISSKNLIHTLESFTERARWKTFFLEKKMNPEMK